MATPDEAWVFEQFARSLPPERISSVVAWAVANKIQLIGSARSQEYDPNVSPWTIAPLECAGRPGRMTLIKPIQSGGSVVGEIAILFWLSTWPSGDVGYFWQNDLSADDRWLKRFEK